MLDLATNMGYAYLCYFGCILGLSEDAVSDLINQSHNTIMLYIADGKYYK